MKRSDGLHCFDVSKFANESIEIFGTRDSDLSQKIEISLEPLRIADKNSTGSQMDGFWELVGSVKVEVLSQQTNLQSDEPLRLTVNKTVVSQVVFNSEAPFSHVGKMRVHRYVDSFNIWVPFIDNWWI